MSRKRNSPVSLLPIDAEHVLCFAMRYALTRNTAAPRIVAREIARKWHRIRGWSQIQMLEEIEAARRLSVRPHEFSDSWAPVLSFALSVPVNKSYEVPN